MMQNWKSSLEKASKLQRLIDASRPGEKGSVRINRAGPDPGPQTEANSLFQTDILQNKGHPAKTAKISRLERKWGVQRAYGPIHGAPRLLSPSASPAVPTVG